VTITIHVPSLTLVLLVHASEVLPFLIAVQILLHPLHRLLLARKSLTWPCVVPLSGSLTRPRLCGAPTTFTVTVARKFSFGAPSSGQVVFSFSPKGGAPTACEETGSLVVPLRFGSSSCTVRFGEFGVWTPSVSYQESRSRALDVSSAPLILVSSGIIFARYSIEANVGSPKRLQVFVGSSSRADNMPPTGNVTFSFEPASAGAPLKCAESPTDNLIVPLSPVKGLMSLASAQCTSTFSAAGTWTAVASYDGDPIHPASSTIGNPIMVL